MFLVNNVSAGFFIATAIINVFITFFAQNYILRKDYLCCKNVAFLLLYKVIIVVSLAVNCIGLKIISTHSTFMVVLGFHLALSGIALITYFMFGFYIYRHTTPKVLLIGSISAYFSLSLTMLYD
jgi:hypothetical protein